MELLAVALSMFIAGCLITLAASYMGASLYARASGQRSPMGGKKYLPFVMKTDEEEAAIERAYEDVQRRKFNEHVMDEVEGLGK